MEFLEDCTRRGLSSPVLVVTDGAAGLIRAVETCFPAFLRQRCLAHKMRNIAATLPDSARAEVTQAARAASQAPSPAMARLLRDDLVQRYQKAYPTAVRCFQLRGIRIDELELAQLERLRVQLIEKRREATKKAKNENSGSAPPPFCSKDRT